jgi:hypothetical protein
MGSPGGPSGDDHPPDPVPDGSGDEISLAVTVPDDASALDGDVATYRKELRAQRRRERLDRWALARWWRPYGLSGPVVIAALVVIGSVGGLLLALLPNAGPRTPQPDPLATATARTGSIGGLLVNDPVYVNGVPKSAQGLRPSVLALVPVNCMCADTVANLASQAGEFGIKLYVVSPEANDPQLPALTTGAANAARIPVTDPGGVLRQAYDPNGKGVSVLLVRSDGVVRNVLTDVNPRTTLHAALTVLNQTAE